MHKNCMTGARNKRLAALTALLRRHSLTRQDELVTALREAGYEVTQATVSRDLDQLGAIKIRRGGETRYTLPDQLGAARSDDGRLRSLFAEWVRVAEPAANLVVLKTPPGSAHLVGVALDTAPPAAVVGTISGDDTLFIACRSPAEAAALAEEWQGWLRG
ncbi:transcriptional regulator of arginine metabolism [Sphingomonas kaistensis]|uniref:Arginine repressor n=1 Tax=Sphingomonas kaistensis TaxID=298708 RepID=A0A7X5Y7J1_9SPHN|nr:arginine repressor [Sphingomonas kaistensis]NJC06451.1 transcriptional regulator of arginine metabolism [Sphingomonas kaistensis]